MAKTTLAILSQITDAALVIQALTPLVEQFANTGKEATPEEVAIALDGMDSALAAFDAEIKRQGG